MQLKMCALYIYNVHISYIIKMLVLVVEFDLHS
jgi:hypothetical protein